MLMNVNDALLISVWEDSFERDNNKFVYYRAMLQVVGEAPMQLKVSKENYETLRGKMGTMGTATIDVDSEPGRKQQIWLADIVSS